MMTRMLRFLLAAWTGLLNLPEGGQMPSEFKPLVTLGNSGSGPHYQVLHRRNRNLEQPIAASWGDAQIIACALSMAPLRVTSMSHVPPLCDSIKLPQ